jgi:hypothetical protein
VDRDEALGRLALRYLAGHAPATARDLATWAGITLTDARLAFARVADELHETPDGFVTGVDQLRAVPPDGARLLGPFDPLLHGWHSRELFVGPHRSVVTTNGIFRATCLVDGRVVGTWTMPSGAVEIRLLERVAGSVGEALSEDAADVLRFLGRAGATVRVSGSDGP